MGVKRKVFAHIFVISATMLNTAPIYAEDTDQPDYMEIVKKSLDEDISSETVDAAKLDFKAFMDKVENEKEIEFSWNKTNIPGLEYTSRRPALRKVLYVYDYHAPGVS